MTLLKKNFVQHSLSLTTHRAKFLYFFEPIQFKRHSAHGRMAIVVATLPTPLPCPAIFPFTYL